MIFRHKTPPSLTHKIRNICWPSMGFKRLLLYYYVLFLRLKGSSHHIACGFSWGIASSNTPFMGFHIILACLLSYITKGNYAAATLGTFVAGNPLTFPFLWFLQYEVGRVVLGQEATAQPINITSFSDVLSLMSSNFTTILGPMIIGGLIMLPVFFIVSYLPMYLVMNKYKALLIKRYYAKHST